MFKSLLIKITMPIVLALIIILSIIGVHIYNSQVELLESIKQSQKEQITTQLKKIEQDSLRKETLFISKLSMTVLGAIAESLYNINMEATQNILRTLMEYESIKAIHIYDKVDKSSFIYSLKDKNNNINFYKNNKFKNTLNHDYFAYELDYEDENIGQITVFYDLSKITKDIDNLKKQDLKIFENEIIKVNKNFQDMLKKEFFVFTFGILIIILIIIFLLRNVINKPLLIFKEGLQSFFDYLGDPNKKITYVNINTNDEFGQMSKSVNKNIKISAKMHKEKAQLMNILDKNVITSETDNNGIIKYVSQAFCEISGYKQEELIGKSHNILKHPDMSHEIYSQLWESLKNNKVWEGELKNLKKDGSYYWVKTIISPKDFKENEKPSYTAVRYDITDKKELENLKKNLEIIIEKRTSDLKVEKKKVETIHKQTRESIDYASMIQNALLPNENIFKDFFKDSFVYWKPKDTVGGDIWLSNKLINKDECLLFFIDCTGHGVPGAFVTMIVKAIEREIMTILNKNEEEISPAWIMSYFNKTMKLLLKQENKNCVSNAGWDGGIIHYNKKSKVLKYSGAKTNLFYVNEKKELITLKSNKYSVGYGSCDMDYKYKEIHLNMEEGMKVYCTTDGYLDQCGGEKDFPFGSKRFKDIIIKNQKETMEKQKNIFIETIEEYKDMIKHNEQNDDITIIAFEI